jgi:hypothetical protein
MKHAIKTLKKSIRLKQSVKATNVHTLGKQR